MASCTLLVLADSTRLPFRGCAKEIAECRFRIKNNRRRLSLGEFLGSGTMGALVLLKKRELIAGLRMFVAFLVFAKATGK